MRCCVCRKKIELKRERVYVVKDGTYTVSTANCFDAIDCQHCGCQHLLKKRLPKEGKQEGLKHG